MKLLFAFSAFLLAPLSAMAQCVGANGINTIDSCPAAVSPQPGDYVLSYQNSQSPHTRKMTLSQIAGGSSVTSVGLALPAFITVSGSPVTSAGTLTGTLATQVANRLFAGPTTGSAAAPTFRAMVAADLPATAVTPGSYTNLNATIDAAGRITAAANGSAGAGTVTTTGSPSSGNLAAFSGATSITNVAQTGTGSVVRATSPTVSDLIVTGSFTATGLVTNADLVNAATTVNGQSCVLGAACTITASAGTVTVGTTAVAGGTTTRILYDNAGVLGEYIISGSGNVAMTTAPTIASPTITGAFTATGLVTNADLVSPSITVNGSTCTLGSSCTPIAGGLVVGSTAIGGGTTTRVLYDNAGVLGEYTNTQLTALVNSFSTSLSGAAPASGGGTTNFLRADGTWTAPAGSGSVTTVSVASANGFAGTVANATTTPAITISTSITGALKGNGTAVSQAACSDLSNGATGCSTATGTSGATIPLLNGTNTWSGTQTFGATGSTVSTQSGTTYTLAATDCGTTIAFTSASAITLTTLNSLAIGCYINILQAGAGQITVANGASATMNSAHSYTKSFGQWALIGLMVDTNAGSAAHFVLFGDGA